MKKEIKVESEEKIIETNGTHIEKHIYTENKDGFLSSILKYDKNNIFIEGEYYTDKNFTDLFYTQKRKYNSDNSFVEKFLYIKPNQAGWVSGIEHYNSNEKYLKGCYYFDKEYRHIRFSQHREYNDNGSFVDKFIFTKPDLAGCLSISQKFDSHNRLIEQNRYADNNFKQVYEHIHREYSTDGSYIANFVYTQPDIEGCLSISQKFDKNDRLLKQNRYIDNNFKEIYKQIHIEYNSDNSSITKFVFEQQHENGWFSAIEYYDSNNKYIKGDYYSDKEYKNLYYSKSREYNNNNFIDKSIFVSPEAEGYLSISQKFDTNNRLIEQSQYTDSNFKEIHKNIHIEYNNDNSRSNKFIYTKQNKKGWISKIEYFDSDKKYLKSEFYFDKECHNLCYSKYREYDTNGMFIDKFIFTKPDIENCLSISQKFDTNNRLIEQKRYLDNKFKKLHEHVHIEYNNDNSYISIFTYTNKNETGWISCIEHYNANNKFIKGYYYSDKEHNNLYYSLHQEYNNDNSYVKNLIYTKRHKIGWFSCIEYYNENNKFVKGNYYSDKEYNDLYFSVYREYNDDGSYSKKTIYEEPDNDGFLSILSKYDKNGSILEAFYYIDNNFTNLGLHTTKHNFFFVYIFKKLGIVRLINKVKNK